MLICDIISGISPTFFPVHNTVKPNTHQTDAFSTEMSLNSYLTSYFLIIYALWRDLGPSKRLPGLLQCIKTVCAHQCYSAHACGVFAPETVSSCLRRRLGLLRFLWCHYTCFSHGTDARRHVWGGSNSMEYNTKQVTKLLQDAGLHLYFCKHSGMKYKWMLQGCAFSLGMAV